MLSRLFSVAIVFSSAAVANAQLPTQNRVSPINYFGRFHGFGYSDGYHECKDTRVRQASFWKPWESMSSYYGEPTSPPAGRAIGLSASYGSPTSLFSPHGSAPSAVVVPQHATPLPGTVQNPVQNYPQPIPQAPIQAPVPSYGTVLEPSRLDFAPIAPPTLVPAPSRPAPSPSYAPSPSDTLVPNKPAPSAPPTNFYETVPPAPVRKDPQNGKDREEFFELPSKKGAEDDYLVPPAPVKSESRRQQGSISLSQPNGKR